MLHWGTARQRRRATPRTRSNRKAIELAPNARTVLERRYLAKDETGRVVETPEELFRRVARNVALAEERYGASKRAVAAVEERYYALMTSFRFLPNSPTLGNAGRPIQQLSACFVLPVDDSMEGIFDTLKSAALIHKTGGGTGFSFSRLRPEGDRVLATGGVASGPVSFMRVFDAGTEAIKQGGTRRGANMAILSVRHPDVEAFINAKADMVTLQNFNISVAVDAEFMEAVKKGRQYALVNPRTGKAAGRRSARKVFRQIVENAWRNGDPGLVFLDRINRDHPTPQLGEIEATNPCGEQPLLPYESCNLGSLNLARFVKPPSKARSRVDGARGDGRAGVRDSADRIDWDALAATIADGVRFLDDVIDQNRYPIAEIEEATLRTRKIGLGVMGWADLLLALRIPYDSGEAIALGERMMAFIQEHADRASEELAAERGVFPAWEGSVYDPAHRFRNATRTTVAPTGTLSIIADCSGGIEPVFALAFLRQHHLDPKHPDRVTQMPEVNRAFERVAKQEGFYSAELMEELARGGSIQGRDDVPEWVRRVYVTSHDIAPEWHVRMQAAFQRHTDNAVSKTINFPASATVEDVERLPARLSRGLQGDHDLPRPVAAAPGALARYRARAGAGGGEGRGGRARPRRAAARGRALPPPPTRRTALHHAQVPRGRTGGLHHGRALRRRQPGRGVYHHLERGLHHPRPDGLRRRAHLARAPVRRAAGGPGAQVPRRPLRAGRLHQQPGPAAVELADRLPLPLAGVALRRAGCWVAGHDGSRVAG